MQSIPVRIPNIRLECAIPYGLWHINKLFNNLEGIFFVSVLYFNCILNKKCL